jgi:glutathione synthase/RimK-type ligase-like ATP-grasp enzyme
MAQGHWQIIAKAKGGRTRYGRVVALPLEDAPASAVEIAVRSASLIGDGFYGVDIKETADGLSVIEVNDNPNVEAGYEDAVLGDRLYTSVMDWFRQRLDARGGGSARGA